MSQSLGNDSEYPRVTYLRYTVEEQPSYKLPDKARDGTIGTFSYSVNKSRAVFQPTVRYADESAARQVLEPLLRAWEIKTALTQGKPVFAFAFYSCDIQEVAPKPGELRGVAMVMFTGRATVEISFGEFPSPAEDFVVDDLTSDLAQIVLNSRLNPLAILKDAFSITTRLEYEFGTLAEASSYLGISVAALERVQNLATQRSAGAHTRKWFKQGKVMPAELSTGERDWLQRAFKVIVVRAGEALAKPNQPQITKDQI